MLKIFITEESQNQQFVADLEAKKLLMIKYYWKLAIKLKL